MAAGLVPTSSTVETVIDDQGIQVQESDAEAAGAWAVGPVTYADHPTVTTTTTYTYGTVVGVLPQDLPAAGTGTDQFVHSESADVSETGSGAGLQATETKSVSDTETRDITWSSARGSGTVHFDSAVTVTDRIGGSAQSPSADSFTDTTTTHREFHSGSEGTYTGPVGGNGGGAVVTDQYSGREDYLGNVTSVEAEANGSDSLVSLSGGGKDTYASHRQATGPGGTEATDVEAAVSTTEVLANGAPQSVPVGSGRIDETGNDPVTGAAVDYHNDKYNPLNPPRIETGDWFSKLADFSAGVADTITGGLTKRVRQGLDLDGVNYNSAAYGVGTKVGTVLDLALSPISPCGKARWLAQSIRGLSAVNATGQAVNAAEAIRNGDPLGALANSVGAVFGFAKLRQACFTAGTPLLTPEGSRPIDQLREGDWVLSRDEYDPDGPVRPRRVVQTFTRVAPILNLHVAGRVIETTREHPFYVDGAGWRNACELRAGDRLVGHDGVRAAVEGVANSGRVETVYNVEVEDDHTHFVGDAEWGCDVWAHNAGPSYQINGGAAFTKADINKATKILMQYERLAAKYGSKVSPKRVAELDRLRDAGTITSVHLPATLANGVPGQLQKLRLSVIQALKPGNNTI